MLGYVTLWTFIFFNKWWIRLNVIIFGGDNISSTDSDKWKYQYQFKANDSEIKPYSLCLGNFSKDVTVDNIKTGLNIYIYIHCSINIIYIANFAVITLQYFWYC